MTFPTLTVSTNTAATSTLHFVGRFGEVYTGAERELLDIQHMLAGQRTVKLWSEVPLHPLYAGKGISLVQPFTRQFPKDGILFIAGVHLRPGFWLKYTRFDRIILLYNLSSHNQLFAVIEEIRDATGKDPELVFVSKMLQLSVSLPGRVIPSLIDLDALIAIERPDPEAIENAAHAVATKPFTVGRLSRDLLPKHHADDVALYRMLAANGVKVRIMGGTCLAGELKGGDGIELLPAGAESVADFCSSLDLFFYRTGTFVEAYGRVVFEAMASGLPVVVSHIGGFAECIQPGVTGIIVRTQEAAYDAVMALKNQRPLARQMGAAARNDTISRHGPKANQEMLQSWLLA